MAHAAWWALGVQVFSWYMQIHPGHAILEGRKPALLDSLVQVGETERVFYGAGVLLSAEGW